MADFDDARGDDASPNPFEEFLRSIFGAEGAEQAAHAMNAQGIDAANLNSMMSDPAAMQQMLGQFRHLMSSTTGPINWDMVRDIARQQAYRNGDPQPTATQAEGARQAMSVADLWLDAVTDFAVRAPSREVWSRVQWVEATLPAWQPIIEPVARNIGRALSDALAGQYGDGGSLPVPEGMAGFLGQVQNLMPRMASMILSAQLGEALTALATESMGSTDVGIPLAADGATALVIRNIEVFGDGLEIPHDEVLQFVAVRECAHVRLFAGVPWLRADLQRAVSTYSHEIAIDTSAVEEAARGVDPSDPDSVREALSGGVFAQQETPAQRRALDQLETLLALVEGWVEDVTALAVAPYLPHAEQLREMMRRRRAGGGPAEQVLGRLIGLQMRPRKARSAARLFTLVQEQGGAGARDALWAHPDVVPTHADLDDPEGFLQSREAERQRDAGIDAELAQLLDGTLGWADGLTPDVDPEAERLRRAGFEDPDAGSGEGDGPGDGDTDAGGDGPSPDGGAAR